MPIDYKKYPKNWHSEIRPAILKRANNRCERCDKPNWDHRASTWMDSEGLHQSCLVAEKGVWYDWVQSTWRDSNGKSVQSGDIGKIRRIKVVLTISHKDHNPKNNKPSNLQALCQRCHLRYDREHHRKKRSLTKARKHDSETGQGWFF